MPKHQWCVSGAVAVLAVTCMGAGIGVKRHVTKPKVDCAVPNYAYGLSRISPKISALSLPGIVLEGSLPDRKERLKYFQFQGPFYGVHHCRISGVVVTLSESGEWTVRLRADQNPQPDGAVPIGAPGDELYKQTGQLLRNRFLLTVRLVANARRGPLEADLVANPSLLEPVTLSFWVEKQQPRDVFVRGYFNAQQTKNFFDVIDGAEFDFCYDMQRASL